MNAARYVVAFDEAVEDTAASLQRFGEKGLRLRELSALGLPVPPGFTLTTDAFQAYATDGSLPADVVAELRAALGDLERRVGAVFGGTPPLLVAVRSGAPVSMPGMLETVLNVGLNDATCESLGRQLGDSLFALRLYLRFLLEFPGQALGAPRVAASETGSNALGRLDESELRARIDRRKKELGERIPETVEAQLEMAIRAVFESWNAPRARAFREEAALPETGGTAASVQLMVFGNRGTQSGSGVVFSRRPSDGKPDLFGEYLPAGQGDEVARGSVTPESVTAASARARRGDQSLERMVPDAFSRLEAIAGQLEQHYKDLQEIEFTIEDGNVYILQARTGKRAPPAEVKVAVDLAREGVISQQECVRRVAPESLAGLFRGQLPAPEALEGSGIKMLGRGLAASPGAASGRIVFSPEEARRCGADGERVILVRPDTSADDVHGMRAAAGVVTTSGGLTSHAAVVARSLGTPCVVSATSLRVDEHARSLETSDGGTLLGEGDSITLDGSQGCVFRGEIPVQPCPTIPELNTLLSWADDARTVPCMAEGTLLSSAGSMVAQEGDGFVLWGDPETGPPRVAPAPTPAPLRARWWTLDSDTAYALAYQRFCDWIDASGQELQPGELWVPVRAWQEWFRSHSADLAPRAARAGVVIGSQDRLAADALKGLASAVFDVHGIAFGGDLGAELRTHFERVRQWNTIAAVGFRVGADLEWARWAEASSASFLLCPQADLARVRLVAGQAQIAMKGLSDDESDSRRGPATR